MRQGLSQERDSPFSRATNPATVPQTERNRIPANNPPVRLPKLSGLVGSLSAAAMIAPAIPTRATEHTSVIG